METDAPRPDRDTAREALEAAARAEAIARHPKVPAWYFPVMALVVAGVMVALMLPSTPRIVVLLAVVVVILTVNRHVQSTTGIIWDAPRLRGQIPFMVALAVVILATAVTVAITDREWVWAVGAGAAAVVVLASGLLYDRKSPGDD